MKVDVKSIVIGGKTLFFAINGNEEYFQKDGSFACYAGETGLWDISDISNLFSLLEKHKITYHKSDNNRPKTKIGSLLDELADEFNKPALHLSEKDFRYLGMKLVDILKERID